MKKRLTYLIIGLLTLVSCTEYDEIAMWNKNTDMGSRLAALEELCSQMNTNINSLQQIVEALQGNDYVTGVAPVVENGQTVGYTITFTKSGPVTIYHGSDGESGSTPLIGVKQDTDGLYYWTLDGEWLLNDRGEKVIAHGLEGKSAYELAVEKGYQGTLEEWLASLNGEDGGKGEAGDDGDNGKSAYELAVENGYQGTLEEWLASLKGNTGSNGKSAYELAVENGYQGTLEEWLASLNGSTGSTGADGKSAYELAVENGYQGTLEEWLASLKGNAGDKGDEGITPRLEIRADGYWYVSYDEGQTWTQLGQATGDAGQNGDSMFSDIDVSNPDYLILTLAGSGEQIKLPYYRDKFDLLFVSGSDRVREMTLYCGVGASVEVTYELTNPLNATIAVECISHSNYQVAVDKSASKITVTAPADPAAVGATGEVLVFASDDERTLMRKLVIKQVKYISYTATEQLYITSADFPGDPYFWGKDCEFLADLSTYDAATGEGRWAYVGTVTDVEPSAFNGEQAIRSIALPEGITYIGHNAFNNSTLESITLPESLVEIDQYAFSKCNLTEITLPANLETLGSSAFDYEGTSRVSPLTKVVFEGNKLETIQLNTFQYCKNLQEIVLPDGLKTIEYNAFENCSALTRIEIPNSVTTIGNSAFIYCTSLVEAIIGDGVTEIGKQAFGECTALKTVVIGRGIQSIGDMAFNTRSSRDQMGLVSVTILFDDIDSGTFPELASSSRGVFPKPGGWDPVSYKIYVPAGTGATYRANWPDYSSLIVEM